ncbi:double-strand break repair protein AddB [Sandaracinobacteroides hominis]|uniref:double-strand break repair protein AddB n=1 Tax=Sandaracinobacteroides hominis TaxID=2780086 RepID=UPI0018F45BDC|nr:double-strand break repair protein AddB [Sandaracinobacteroides hominis]
MSSRPGLTTIPGWRPFADDLAAGLIARHPDPLDLARVHILLPTRRAVRALGDAFVRQSEGKALLLPRLAPVGDVESDDFSDQSPGAFAETLEGPAEALPPVAPHARRLALAKILAGPFDLAAAEALALANQLAATLDALEIEGRRAADIAEAVPEGELQGHWQKNARILEALMRFWPELLAERGVMDSSARRNLQLAALTARYAAAPPAHPVFLAGFASAPPALARLARVLVRSPGCGLILPGFDTGLDADTWEMIHGSDSEPGLETHPQFGMAQLLRRADVSPLEVEPWPHQSPLPGSSPARAALAGRAMQPPELSGERSEPAAPEALAGLRLVETANSAEEALVIALALRQVAERPGTTAALVTPDRALARRVTVQLKRFGIDIDDSAGTPLAVSPPGSLLVAIAAAAGERFAPVPLLALLQHPLVRAGADRLHWLNRVRSLDLAALHGLRPPPGLEGISRRLAYNKAAPDLRDWWAEEAAPLIAPLDRIPANAEALVDQLRAVAHALAGDALWAGEGGRTLARLFEALEASRADLASLPIEAADAAAFATALMSGETVRPRASKHPQLAIWGPLEARLQSADLLIMGGLNEGVWPGTPAPDPFLAPAIRRALGLPGLARRTGLQAHDFVSGLGAREVLLTRAAREGSAPSVPSRFWQRLAAAAGSTPDDGRLSPSAAALLAVACSLDNPTQSPPIPQPAPQPPAADRPRRIRVTEVAMLKADPFAFYARHMLGLKPLDPRDAEPTGGERGQAVHNILEQWLTTGGELAPILTAQLAKLGDRPELEALWRPRVERMIDFVVEAIDADEQWQPLAPEVKASLLWNGITLNGRADRIDKSKNGQEALRILDYKTGALPSVGDVAGLWETQLGLLGAMLQAGAFEGIPATPVAALDYVKLSGGVDPGRLRAALGTGKDAKPVPEHISEAWRDFQELAAQYLLGDRPFTAKTHLVHGRRFRDYDHLARVAEWLGR